MLLGSKRALLVLTLFLLLINVAFAVKPVAQVGTGTNGLDVEIPAAQYIKVNTLGTVHTHVFNQSNGMPITNATASCYIDIYNSTGSHIVEAQMRADSNLKEFAFDINRTVTGKVQLIPFIIWCNSTGGMGGFVSSSIEITQDGETDVDLDSTAGISTIIFLLFIISGLFYLGFSHDFFDHPTLNDLFKKSSIILGLLFLSLATATLASIANASHLPILDEIFRFMFFINWTILFTIGFVVFMFFLNALKFAQEMSKTRRGIA